MVDLDLKDRKILYQLDLNCRQSNAQIGKKVGLSRKVVDYRIKRMEEEGIIEGYWILINSFKLGYEVYRYYITFQNATQKIKDEIVDFLIEYKNIWTVYSASGLFDLGVVIWVKDLRKFQLFWEKFNDIYGDYISEKIYSVMLSANGYRHTYLIQNDYENAERKKIIPILHETSVEIDKLDYDLLNIIVLDARKPIIEISKQLKCSSQTVNYRIKNLTDKGIIKCFKVSINYSKLGLQQIMLNLWLRKLSKRKEIWHYFENYPYVIYLQTSAGYADMQVELVINSTDKIEDFLQEISDKFPDSIRKFNFFTMKEQFIIRCLPEIVLK